MSLSARKLNAVSVVVHVAASLSIHMYPCIIVYYILFCMYVAGECLSIQLHLL